MPVLAESGYGYVIVEAPTVRLVTEANGETRVISMLVPAVSRAPVSRVVVAETIAQAPVAAPKPQPVVAPKLAPVSAPEAVSMPAPISAPIPAPMPSSPAAVPIPVLVGAPSAPVAPVLAASAHAAPSPVSPTGASVGEQIRAGIRSSFAFPIEDLYVRKHESAARELLDGLTLVPGISVPFNSRTTGAGSTGARLSGSTALTLDIRYQPVGYWFAQIQLAAYLQPSKRAPWNGDFSYSFGYDDYHPYTFSLVYSNYSNNRFDPRAGDPITRLARGTLSLGWKAPLPDGIARALLFDDSLHIDCRVGLNVSPRYDRDDGGVGSWKQSASLGCRYPFTKRLFVDFNAYVYGSGQQPWDPDFTYSLGLADYRSGHFSIIYANYSGNRFPGRARGANTGTFLDGGLFLSWNRQF